MSNRARVWLRRVLAAAVGVGVSSALVVALALQVDFGMTWRALRGASVVWLLATLPASALAVWAQAVRAQALMRPMSNTATSLQVRAVLVGLVGNAILPFRLGEAARVALIARRTDLTTAAVVTAVVVERMLDALALLALALGVLPLLSGGSGQVGSLVAAAAMLVVGLSALFVLARSQRLALRTVETVASWFPTGIAGRVLGGGGQVVAALQVLRDPRAMVVSSAATVVSFAGTVLAAAAVLRAFEAGAGWLAPASMTVSTTLALAVPSAPSAVGAHHWANTQVLVLLHVPEHTALAVAVAFHFMVFVPWVVGSSPLVLADLWHEWRRLTGVGSRTA